MQPPSNLQVIGRPEFIHVCGMRTRDSTRNKQDKQAKDLSQKLFFLQNQLNNQLVTKLKVLGKNAVYTLRCKITITDQQVSMLMTGTAMCLAALPIPRPPIFRAASEE